MGRGNRGTEEKPGDREAGTGGTWPPGAGRGRKDQQAHPEAQGRDWGRVWETQGFRFPAPGSETAPPSVVQGEEGAVGVHGGPGAQACPPPSPAA